MAKRIIISLVFCIFMTSFAFADETKDLLLEGIKSYKEGNYLKTIQTMEKAIKDNPENALAYYYTAISYVKLGDIVKAQIAYDNVIMLSPNSQLSKYSETGKQLMRPSKKEAKPVITKNKKPEEKNYTGNIEKDMEERNLKFLIEKINRNQPIDPEEYQDFQDFSPGKSSIDMPGSEEVAKALQTLARAGINPMQGMGQFNSGMSPEMMQMSMMTSTFGGAGGQQTGNSMNMLPLLMMMQAQNGQGRGNGSVDPQLMQSMLSNMMMPDMMNFYEKKDY